MMHLHTERNKNLFIFVLYLVELCTGFLHCISFLISCIPTMLSDQSKILLKVTKVLFLFFLLKKNLLNMYTIIEKSASNVMWIDCGKRFLKPLFTPFYALFVYDFFPFFYLLLFCYICERCYTSKMMMMMIIVIIVINLWFCPKLKQHKNKLDNNCQVYNR